MYIENTWKKCEAVQSFHVQHEYLPCTNNCARHFPYKKIIWPICFLLGALTLVEEIDKINTIMWIPSLCSVIQITLVSKDMAEKITPRGTTSVAVMVSRSQRKKCAWQGIVSGNKDSDAWRRCLYMFASSSNLKTKSQNLNGSVEENKTKPDSFLLRVVLISKQRSICSWK